MFQEKPGKYEVSKKLKASPPVQADEIEAEEAAQKGRKILKLAQTDKHPFDAAKSKEKPVALQPRSLEEARNWLKAQKVLIDNGIDPSKEFLALIGLKKPTDDPLFSFGKEKIVAAIKKLQDKVGAVDDGVLGRVTYLAILNKYPEKYADARLAALGPKPETKTVVAGRFKKRPEKRVVDLGDEPEGGSLLAALERRSGPDARHKSPEEELARKEWGKARTEKEKIKKELDLARTESAPDAKKIMALEAQYAAAEKAETDALEKGARAKRAADFKRQQEGGVAGGD